MSLSSRQNIIRLSLTAALICGVIGFSLGQQADHALLSGQISDESGSLVPNASVQLINLITGETKTTSSDATGQYVFGTIIPARYLLQVGLQGFDPHRLGPLLLERGDQSVQDVTLSVATVQERIVVTASRRKELVSQAALSSTLIERQEIEDTTSETLEQLLVERAGSGIYVSRGFGIGFPQINGIGGNRVLVLVDGRRQIGDDGIREGIDLDQYTTADIDRVEIIKGPSSSLYGSDAMGGVINLITRQPERPLSFDFSNSYGSFGEQNYAGTLGFKAKNLGGILTGLYRSFDGYDLDDSEPGTDLAPTIDEH